MSVNSCDEKLPSWRGRLVRCRLPTSVACVVFPSRHDSVLLCNLVMALSSVPMPLLRLPAQRRLPCASSWQRSQTWRGSRLLHLRPGLALPLLSGKVCVQRRGYCLICNITVAGHLAKLMSMAAVHDVLVSDNFALLPMQALLLGKVLQVPQGTPMCMMQRAPM